MKERMQCYRISKHTSYTHFRTHPVDHYHVHFWPVGLWYEPVSFRCPLLREASSRTDLVPITSGFARWTSNLSFVSVKSRHAPDNRFTSLSAAGQEELPKLPFWSPTVHTLDYLVVNSGCTEDRETMAPGAWLTLAWVTADHTNRFPACFVVVKQHRSCRLRCIKVSFIELWWIW